MKLCDIGVHIEQENDAAWLMGVNLELDEETGSLKIKQPVLIDHLISAVVLENCMAKGKYTSVGSVTLAKN